jgi:TolA-binding protein
LISNGLLACTDREYDKPVTQLHVGEKLFLMVTDPDQDTSDERDVTEVEISTEFGEREKVALVETLVHSGVFTGSFALQSNEKPTPDNLKAGDPAIECYFGDIVRVRYIDSAASTETGTLVLDQEVPVVIGTDGLVAAFSKTFNDEKLAVETKFHIAESYFELFKSHRELGRGEEEKTDLASGRRILREVMEDYPDPKYVPRIAYLLGQFSQELENWGEAAESYEMIVRQFPDHPLAADAQYKLAQTYEEAGDFDEALEAYVTLAATYPKSPLIASVMIRISDHFYKAEEYDIAAQVGEKFLERFEGHQHAARIAFRVGQCSYKAETFQDAGLAFDRFSKFFPEDELSPDALFWSGESYRMANNTREAFRRYNRCRWDFPESEAARYARGRLALPEMLQQFEAEARSVEDP